MKKMYHLVKTIFIYKMFFASFGLKSKIISPLKINGIGNIHIGKNVVVQYKTWLAAMPLTGNKPKLVIGDGCKIGHFNHIFATSSIHLGENVLTADKVYISDNLHSYEDPHLPIMNQPIKQIRSVSIGRGSWLGENVVVLGAKIGKNCVIGANSVVTKDIPDYCVAVGAPARVIKKFNFSDNKWEKIS